MIRWAGRAIAAWTKPRTDSGACVSACSVIVGWSCCALHGVVEQTPDYSPILDRLESPAGFVIATASGHGFGLCPAIGKWSASW